MRDFDRIGCWAVIVGGALLAVSCGDDAGGGPASPSSPTGTDGGDPDPGSGSATSDGEIRAVIDGTPWQGMRNVRARIDEDLPGAYILEGTGEMLQQLRLDLFYVDASGSYPFGVTPTVVGASASVTRSTAAWQAPGSGDAGTLTITELDPGRIAGMFELSLVPVPGTQAMGTLMVTDGEFDLPFEGEAIEVGPDQGSTLSAELGGEHFNAASVLITPNPTGLAFNAINDDYNVGFVLGSVDAAGTYELSFDPPARGVVVIAGSKGEMASHCCWGAGLGDSGSVTFTTVSAERLVGTFELTLDPQAGSAASEPLVITSGEFDIGRAEL